MNNQMNLMNNYAIYATALAAAACIYAVIGFASSRRLKLRTAVLETEKFAGKVNILHISDLHNCKFGDEQSVLSSLANKLKPDIILLSGDIVEDAEALKHRGEGRILTPDHPAAELISGLVKIAPVFMTLGNHEANIARRKDLEAELRELGVSLVGGFDSNGILVEVHGEGTESSPTKLFICGADDPRCLPYNDDNSPERLRNCPKSSFFTKLARRIRDDRCRNGGRIIKWRKLQIERFSSKHDRENSVGATKIGGADVFSILLSHRPEEQKLYRELGFDAAFSGHAHGGQFRFPPFINGLYAPHQGIFPRIAGGFYALPKAETHRQNFASGNLASSKSKISSRRVSGRKCIKSDMFLHSVSRGLCVDRFPRFFNPPEVSLVTVVGKNPKEKLD